MFLLPLPNSQAMSTTLTWGMGRPLARSGKRTIDHLGSVSTLCSASMEGVADPSTKAAPQAFAFHSATSRET